DQVVTIDALRSKMSLNDSSLATDIHKIRSTGPTLTVAMILLKTGVTFLSDMYSGSSRLSTKTTTFFSYFFARLVNRFKTRISRASSTKISGKSYFIQVIEVHARTATSKFAVRKSNLTTG